MRRLPLLLLLVLLPVPAQADQHNMESSLDGVTGSFTVRLSSGIRLWSKYDSANTQKGKESLFLFGDAYASVAGRDSDHAQDGLMIGLRYRTRGQRSVEPFFHISAGAQRPSRPDGDDDATDWSAAGAVGLGFDFELNPEKKTGIIWLLRFQGDWVASHGLDSQFRASVGLAFRDEGH